MRRRDSISEGYDVRYEGEPGGEVMVHLGGRVALETVPHVQADLERVLDELHPSRLVIDLADVTFMDSAGALTIFELEHAARSSSIPCQRVGPSEAAAAMLSLVSQEALETEPVRSPRGTTGFLEFVGRTSLDIYRDFLSTMTFLGEFLVSAIYVLRHPRELRGREVFAQMARVGMDGLPLVGVIGFLLGVVIALMAFDQLRQFGGTAMLPTVVTMAMVKQFGPLITAILVAGRSGSAFAAEIATMHINEEVDALRIMGFNPVRFLAFPRVLATILVVPVLAVYGNLLGILGGMLIGVADAGMSVISYIQGIPQSIGVGDAVESLIKSAVFGALVAGIGCQRGFRVRNGAEEVGTSTTSAVVSSIFLIIFTDALAALVTSRLGL